MIQWSAQRRLRSPYLSLKRTIFLFGNFKFSYTSIPSNNLNRDILNRNSVPTANKSGYANGHTYCKLGTNRNLKNTTTKK